VYSRETVDAGALLSYGPSNYAIFRRSDYYIDKILKGAQPSDLPVEQPTSFEYIVNPVRQLAAHEAGRRATGELAEIARQTRLIGIAAGPPALPGS
jgi:hypothetical protein